MRASLRLTWAPVLLSVVMSLAGCGGRSALKRDAGADGRRTNDAGQLPDGRFVDAPPDVAVVPDTRPADALDGRIADVPADARLDGAADGRADGPADARSDAADAMPTVVVTGVDITPALATAAAGTTARFTATARFSNGTTRDVTALATWSSAAANIAPIANGVAEARSQGTVMIRASYMGVTGSAQLTVTTAALRQIALEPLAPKVPRGTRVAFRASGVFSDGNRQDITTQVMWTSSNMAIATVDATGAANAVGVGTANVSAAFMGVTATTTIEVTAATLAMLEVTPAMPTLPLPGTQQFTATGIYNDGTTADLTAAVMWESSAPGVVAIAGAGSLPGRATSVAAGTATITARLGGLSASSAVTVSPAALVSIRVTPEAATVPKGLTASFRATGRYSDGTSADITAGVAWSSGSAAVATVSNAAGSQGLATGLSPGGAEITATVGAVSGSAKLTVTDATVASLTVTPMTATVPAGRRVQFTAVASLSDGSTIAVTESATWSTGDAAVAGVSNSAGTIGVVTGLAPGATQVTATYAGKSASAPVMVTTASLDAIAISPATVSVPAGLRASLTATGTYSDGTKIDLTNQVTWSTANATIATVSNAAGTRGQVTGLRVGMTTARATLDGKTGTAAVTVIAPEVERFSVEPIRVSARVGTRFTLQAFDVLSNGTTRVVMGAAWTSGNNAIATVSTTGSGMCVAAGMTTITATHMGRADTATVTCTVAMPVALELRPATATVNIGQTAFFQAVLVNDDGSVSAPPINQLTFSSSNMAVATVMNFGIATGVSGGTATITARHMGLTATATLTVRAAPSLVSVSISPSTVSMRVGQPARQLQALATFSDGTTQDVTSVAIWESSNQMIADVATVRARGQVNPVSAGMATITATYMGLSGSATVTVTVTKLTGVVVSPANARLVVNQTQRYTATAQFDDGTSQNVSNEVTWASSDTSVASISTALDRGNARALKEGTTMISATYMGVTNAVALTVIAPKLVGLQVSPATNTMRVGEVTQYQAIAVYEDGTSQQVTPAWTSSNTSVATISAQGGVAAMSGGTTTLTATYMGQTGTAELTVTAAAMTGLRVTPAMTSLKVGAMQAYKAEALFADGAVQDVTFRATWASSNTAVATVSNGFSVNHGVATAKSAGTANVTATFMGFSAAGALVVAE